MKRRITKILKIIGVILGVIVLIIGAMAIIQLDFSNDENLDVFIENKMKKSNVQGIAAVFIENGQITWSKNYGYADQERSKKVTDETIFQIGSVSKTVTGAAVMQLYENGLIDLDSSINNYLPFEIVNPHSPGQEITVRMLLQHKSSLIDDDPVLKSTYTIESGLADPAVTLEEFVRAYFLEGGKWYDAEKNFSKKTPGEEHSYSNAGFGLLGYIVEYVSGEPFNEYSNDNIFTPLGMESSGWLAKEINLENMTVHYDQGNPLKPYSFPSYPDGALKTTALDYSKFLMAMMNGGVYKGQRILEESTVKEMLPENREENLVWTNDALGEFLVINTKDQKIQGHAGGDPGVFSVVYFNPENDRGVVLFVNSTTALLGFKVFNIISIVNRLGREAQLY